MLIKDAIDIIDSLRPNQYTDEDKVRWLSVLDGKAVAEVIETHERTEPIEWEAYTMADMDAELLIPAPYDYDVYINWLMAQIDMANAEVGKYNQSISLYNNAYLQWQQYYNRHHMPIGYTRFRW